MLRRLILAIALFATASLAAAPAFAQSGDIGEDIVQQATQAVVNLSIWRLRSPARQGEAPRRMKAHGSGFIIDPSGLIVTNKHVIDDAIDILVVFSNGSRTHATLVAAAAMADLALVKVSVPDPLPVLNWGDSNRLRIGTPVLKIGNPLGVGISVAAGIISGLNRDLQDTPFDSFIQTDAAINVGDSGGPLVNQAGEAIGVTTSLYNTDPNGGFIGIGFAIPSSAAKFIVSRLLDPSHPKPGWLGLKLQDVTPELADAFGMSSLTGCVIVEVDPQGPARALLQPGDVLERIDDMMPKDSRSCMRAIVMHAAGQAVTLSVLRNGVVQSIAVTVAEWPNAEPMGLTKAMAEKPLDLGLKLEPAEGGVLVAAVDPDSEAGELGVVAGDMILLVQGSPVATPADVISALAAAQEQHRSFAALLVQGKAGKRWISLSIGGAGG